MSDQMTKATPPMDTKDPYTQVRYEIARKAPQASWKYTPEGLEKIAKSVRGSDFYQSPEDEIN